MKHGVRILMAGLLLAAALVTTLPEAAFAQASPAPPPAASPAGGSPSANSEYTCTNFKERKQEVFGGTEIAADGTVTQAKAGLLTEIYNYIKEIVGTSTQRLYESFIDSPAYQAAVYGALTLMIVIFGVGFVIGVIQPSFGQVLIRLIKFGIIIALISPGGWAFFSQYMVAFFNDGTDELVRGVTAIGTGVTPPPGSSPFYQFDRLAAFLLQPDTFIAIMSSAFSSGPYGLVMSGLMIFAMGGFVQLLVDALKIYAVSYVARALLLGLAPVFFVFLLFERTKQLFMQWINALLALALQPILLFTFLSFFMVLIESASRDMLNTEFCWTEYQNINGASNKGAGWRPANPETGAPDLSESTWRGTFSCITSGRDDCPEFPMNLIDTLTFLILVYLAKRFAKIIERIANELANTYIALDAGGRFDQFMQSGGRGQQQAPPTNRSATRTDPQSQQQQQQPQQRQQRQQPDAPLPTQRPPAPGGER